MAPAVGTRFGSYQISAALGAGAMGDVYRARHTRLGRDVAIKLLPPAFTADADRLSRCRWQTRSMPPTSAASCIAT
jgi:serine/threonine protein kinase